MNMDFGEGIGFVIAGENADDEMAVGGKRVVLALLFAGQVPAGVKPVRVAGGEEQLLGAVGFGQFAGVFHAVEMFRRRHRAERVTLAGTAGDVSRRLIAFQQNGGRIRSRFFYRRFLFEGGSGGFGDAGNDGGFFFRSSGGFRCLFGGFFRGRFIGFHNAFPAVGGRFTTKDAPNNSSEKTTAQRESGFSPKTLAKRGKAEFTILDKHAMSDTKSTDKPAGNSGPLIYVVDDEPMLLELATVILEPEGYQVQSFRDPELALKTFTTATSRPALLITDYAMHSMNGMQLVEAFRRLEPKQKILLVSGTVAEDIFRDSTSKPDKFLAKPYQAVDLTNLVKELLK